MLKPRACCCKYDAHILVASFGIRFPLFVVPFLFIVRVVVLMLSVVGLGCHQGHYRKANSLE
jgi:hypothetical protein